MDRLKADIVAAIKENSDLLSPSDKDNPYGKIISPLQGSVTDTVVTVDGETKNIAPGQYIWVVVEKPEFGLCWPKSPRIKPNAEFKTTIYEEGNEGTYNLSLYAINDTINDLWHGWLVSIRYKGLPMPPDTKRLDTIELVKGSPKNNNEFFKLFKQFNNKDLAYEINKVLLQIEGSDKKGLLPILEQLQSITKE